jgi:hypothetical protein
MKKKLIRIRRTTVGEFTAEAFEAEAKGMPPSYKAQAEMLRRIAKHYREFGSSKQIVVREWEETE